MNYVKSQNRAAVLLWLLTTYNQTERLVLYACSLQFNLPGTYKVSQCSYEKFVFLSEKRTRKNTLYLSKKTIAINVFYFE